MSSSCSSVSGKEDLRMELLVQSLCRIEGLMTSHSKEIHSSLIIDIFFGYVYMGKRSLTLKEYCRVYLLTLSQTTNFRLFHTERVLQTTLELDENNRKFSERVENTLGKGEIARYEQFLLFLKCFQKTYTPDT